MTYAQSTYTQNHEISRYFISIPELRKTFASQYKFKGVITCRVRVSVCFIKKKASVREIKYLRALSFDFWNLWCFRKLNASSARWCIWIRYLSATIKTLLQQSITASDRVPSGVRNRIFQTIDSCGVRLCIHCESSPNSSRTYPQHFPSISRDLGYMNRWF